MRKTLLAAVLGVPFLVGGITTSAQAQAPAPQEGQMPGPTYGTPSGEMQPAKALPGESPILQANLGDKLGSDWTVEKQGAMLVAVRKTPQRPEASFNKDVNDQIQSLQKNKQGMTAQLKGDQVQLGGEASDCNDLPDQAKDFAKIQGVNRIVLSTRCGKTQ